MEDGYKKGHIEAEANALYDENKKKIAMYDELGWLMY